MIRMRLKTFQELKAMFPAHRNESMADYFQRLANAMETGTI